MQDTDHVLSDHERLEINSTAPSWGEAADIAYEKILALLLEGALPQGSRLRENHLATLTGVSRTPVRQALNRLASEGVISISRNRGARVLQFTDEDARGLLDLRAQFEPYAARLSVARMGEDHIQILEDLAAQMEALQKSSSHDPILMSRLNNQFHGVFIEHCGNRQLMIALQSVLVPAMVARTFGRYNPTSLRRSMAHHAELIEAARANDGEWAESVMRTHLLAARHAYPGLDP